MAEARLIAYAAAAGIVALDRVTKWAVERYLSFTDTYQVIPGFFDLIRSQNRGVAFGILNDSAFEWRTAALALISTVAVIIISFVLWRSRLDRITMAGLSLILGGAAGNAIDRITTGRVTDFLLFYIGQYQWPAFNVADSALVAGTGLLLLDAFRTKRQAQHVP